MVAVAAHAEQGGGERAAVPEEVGLLDECEPLVEPGAADEHRRDGEEELVDERCREQRAGHARPGVQSERGAAFIVPEPITTASAHARRRPITNRSLALSAAMTRFELGSEGTATTPSALATKLTNTDGESKPSGPP